MPKNVLVLNDSSGSLTPLIKGLAQSGYTAYSTENPHNCVELFSQVQASTLMLSLTDPNALDSLQVIRMDPDGATVPIILFGTGTEGISTAASAQEQGGDLYFEHPINLPEVIGKVQSFVGSGEASPVPIPQQHIFEPLPEDSNPPAPEVAPEPPTLPNFDTDAMQEIRRELDENPPDLKLEKVSDLLLDEIQQKDTIEETARSQADAKKKHLEIELARRKATTQQRLTQLEHQQRAEEDAQERQELEQQAQEEVERERQRTQLEEQKQLTRVLRAQIERAEQERNAEASRRQELAIQLETLNAERNQAPAPPQNQPHQDHLTAELKRQSLLLEELQRQARQNQAELQAQQQAIAMQLKERMSAVTSPTPTLTQTPASPVQPSWDEQPSANAPLPSLPLQPLQPPPESSPFASTIPQPPPREDVSLDHTPSIDFSPPLTAAQPNKWAPLPLSQQEQGGDLSSPNAIPELFVNLWRNQFSGRVDFLRDTLHKSIFFENGSPVDAHSNDNADRYEEYLHRTGKLERTHCQVILQSGLSGSRRIGAFLVSKGLLKPEELFTCASAHLREVVVSLFGWEEGTSQFFSQSVADDARVVLDTDPRALIVEGIRRKHLLPRLMGILGSPGTVVNLVPNAIPDWDVLKLTQDELRVLTLMDGTRTIEELVFNSRLDALRVYHLLSALVTLQVAQVVSRGAEEFVSTPCAPQSSIDHRRIQNKLEQVQQRDYFEILGVERSATSYEIEQAYERFCYDFAPDRLPPELKTELRRDLSEIHQVVEDARLVLLNPQTREAYAHHLS